MRKNIACYAACGSYHHQLLQCLYNQKKRFLPSGEKHYKKSLKYNCVPNYIRNLVMETFLLVTKNPPIASFAECNGIEYSNSHAVIQHSTVDNSFVKN